MSPRVEGFILRLMAAMRNGDELRAVLEESKQQLSDSEFRELRLFFSTTSPTVREVLLSLSPLNPDIEAESAWTADENLLEEELPGLTDTEVQEFADYFERQMSRCRKEMERRGLGLHQR